jgi:hypothetical protein
MSYTFVYICREGENEELRYSIRSVIDSFPDADIWVVGGKPDWYVGNHLPVPQTKSKYNNARENLLQTCHMKDISEEFVLMNDDFFIIDKINKINEYHGGPIREKSARYNQMYQGGQYARFLADTYYWLTKQKINEPMDYDIHVPMKMKKQNLLKIIGHKNVLWRSAYGNMFGSGGKEIHDVKVYSEGFKTESYDWKNPKTPYLSTMDSSMEGEVLEFLQDRFPNKSNLER